MITDATDNTVNPNSKSNIEVVTVDSVANVDPLRDPQTQPRVLARQIPSSTARGQMQLGAPNIFTDSPGRRILTQDDNQVNVVSMGNIGLDSSGTQLWGLKVAKPGVDVTTATDSQLVFNSQQNVFKIVKEGTVPILISYVHDVSRPDLAYSYGTVQHSLGFTPLVVASFAEVTASGGPFAGAPLPFMNFTALSFLIPDGVGGTTTQVIPAINYLGHVYDVNSVQVSFEIGVAQSLSIWNNQTVTVKYWLLQESADNSVPDTGSVL